MDGNAATGVEVRDNPKLHRFEVDLGGDTYAVAEYNLLSGKIMFTHTEVPNAFEGRGIGTALIQAGLSAARERGLQVIPACHFFASYIQRHAEEQDLLEPSYRSVLGLDR